MAKGDKAAAAAAAAAAATTAAANKDGLTNVAINLSEFSRTRENVLLSLNALQGAVADLSRAYMNHTSTVLSHGENDVPVLNTGFINFDQKAAGPVATPAEVPGEKKKRKRAPLDPHAPKRPLTPYFLYMETARPKIKGEMPDAKPKEIAEEGTKRWREMLPRDTEQWKAKYEKNMEKYRKDMEAYKAKKLAADIATNGELAAVAGEVDAAGSSEAEDEDESEPEPAKVPTPPRAAPKRRKKDDPKPVTPSKDAATPKKASPEKKKKEKPSAKKAKEAKEKETPKEVEAAPVPKSTEKKKVSRKRKSDVAGVAN